MSLEAEILLYKLHRVFTENYTLHRAYDEIKKRGYDSFTTMRINRRSLRLMNDLSPLERIYNKLRKENVKTS